MTMLESRTDVQKQISQVVGQTNNDREDHILYLLVQLKKDIPVLVEADTSTVSGTMVEKKNRMVCYFLRKCLT